MNANSTVRTFAVGMIRAYRRHPIGAMAAALAFYGLFALPPLVVTSVFLGDTLIDLSAVHGSVLDGVERTMGAGARERVQDMVERAPDLRSDVLVSLIGLGAFLFAAVAGMRHFQSIVNTIWEVEPVRGVRFWVAHLVRQISSTLAIALVAALFLAGAGTGLLVAGFSVELRALLPRAFPGAFVHGAEILLVTAVVGLALALLYKAVPDRAVPWRAALGGGGLAALGLVVGRYPLAVYLHHTWRSTVFGAASVMVGVLVALYIFIVIVLLGVVATRVLAGQES